MMILKSLASAFLMYSRIPVPQVEWKEENRRYALCFFPLVGAVISAFFWLWQYVCAVLDIGVLFKSAVSVLLPLIVTGGIHMDGFCDVIDAKSSYADKAKKLEIMSDPHVGSFAVMRLCMYFLLQTALFSELTADSLIIIACGYVLSRSLSGIAAVTFRSAKSEGALQNFSKPAHKKITLSVLIVITAAMAAAILLQSIIIGGFAVIGAVLSFVYYRVSAYKNFGGITGDTAGWFLQICEISVLLFTVIGEKITEVSVI